MWVDIDRAVQNLASVSMSGEQKGKGIRRW